MGDIMLKYVITTHNGLQFVLFGNNVQEVIHNNICFIEKIIKRCVIQEYSIIKRFDNQYDVVISYVEKTKINNKTPIISSVKWSVMEQEDDCDRISKFFK